MKKNNNNLQKQKGFTLLETLVAIFILTLSITGPVYIASLAFRNTIDSRDNISAQYLAEEVIEVFKNNRDKESFKRTTPTNTWLTDIGATGCLNPKGESTNKCIMIRDTLTGIYNFQVCDGICPSISFDPRGLFNVYGESNTTTYSKFTREFYIETETLAGSDTLSVIFTVNIKWDDKGREKIYSLKERLYDINYNQFFSTIN